MFEPSGQKLIDVCNERDKYFKETFDYKSFIDKKYVENYNEAVLELRKNLDLGRIFNKTI